MQRLREALCLAFVVLLGGCGDDPPKATGPAALKHVPADADIVLVAPTDLEGEQLQRLDSLLEPAFREGDERNVRDVFASFFEDVDLNLELSDVDDVSGAAVARTNFSTWDSDPLGLETVPLGEGVGELEASREGIDAQLRIDVPGGLDE